MKICGLSDQSGTDAALEAEADLLGFVFFEGSPRNVSMTAARALGAHVDGRAKKVALTVDADDATLAAIIEALRPDLLQLHGSESVARVAHVRSRFGLPVMRAIAIATPEDLRGVSAYDGVADHLLFDARAPDDAGRPGGNGVAFDWSILRDIRTRGAWFLAGGLNGENVARAVRRTGAPGVDVSSGVETAPGRKDAAKIARFVACARA